MTRLRVRDLVGLAGVAAWAQRLPLFDSADPVDAAEPTVAIIYSGQAIATVVCATDVLRHAVEMICTSVIIKREDGWLKPAFPPPPQAKRRRASSLPADVIDMRIAA